MVLRFWTLTDSMYCSICVCVYSIIQELSEVSHCTFQRFFSNYSHTRSDLNYLAHHVLFVCQTILANLKGKFKNDNSVIICSTFASFQTCMTSHILETQKIFRIIYIFIILFLSVQWKSKTTLGMFVCIISVSLIFKVLVIRIPNLAILKYF